MKSIKELNETLNKFNEEYNEEIARELFAKVNVFSPIEEYIIHTPGDYFTVYMSGDYLVLNKVTMERIMQEVIDSLQKTLPAELQMCFDFNRAVNTCMDDIHILGSVYNQVQALDKRFDTEFGMIQREYMGEPYYIINLV